MKYKKKINKNEEKNYSEKQPEKQQIDTIGDILRKEGSKVIKEINREIDKKTSS